MGSCAEGLGCHLQPELGPCEVQCAAYCRPSETDPCGSGLRCVAFDDWFGTDSVHASLVGADLGLCIPESQTHADCCEVARCGGVCVDTTSDPDHCGACDAACTVGGQWCISSSCSCPPDVGATPSIALQAFGDEGGTRVASLGLSGLRPSLSPNFSRLRIEYDPASVPVGTAITLGGSSPRVTLEELFDPVTETSDFPTVATGGTLTLTKACADGLAGTLSGVTLAAIPSISDPTPISGGCTYGWSSYSFDVGTCP